MNNKNTYIEKSGTIEISSEEIGEEEYKCYTNIYEEEEITLKIKYNNDVLTINDSTITEHCSSYLLYHEFLIFTCSSSGMYDKMFIFSLLLDKWLFDDERRGIESIESMIEER